jgi:hypothetical protein
MGMFHERGHFGAQSSKFVINDSKNKEYNSKRFTRSFLLGAQMPIIKCV